MFGDTRRMPGTSFRMATPSSSVRLRIPREPVRTPATLRDPASTQTRLSPSADSCSFARVDPASPMAMTHTTDATPIVMPSVFSALRVL